ncbi:MAG: penicillin-binding protein 1C, partial [Pseudomonadota bacterium]
FEDSEAPPQILFPPKDAELWAGDVNGQRARAFIFAGRGDGDLNWYVDGQPIAPDAGGLPAWTPQRAGFYQVSAVDAAGRASSVRVRVLGAE